MSRARRDGPGRLLALATWLLPAGRRDWGLAMCAESAAIQPARERWRHALGCMRVVLVQPAVLRTIGYPLLAVAAFGGALRWSAGIAYAPLRWGVVAVVTLLLGIAWWGRHRGVLGPVGAGPVARALRAGGAALVGALAATFASAAGSHGPPQEQATVGLPVFGVILTVCLLAVLAVTAERTDLSGPALRTGAAASVAAAGWWLTAQLVAPPIPGSAGGAVVVTGFGVAAAVFLGARRQDRVRAIWLVALCVAALTPLLLFAEVLVLSTYGPARLIPDLVPMALSPADDLANSRIEVQDPYVALLFLAGLAALVLVVVAAAGRRPAAHEVRTIAEVRND
ncbi:hypothetical protein [Dactylosporangium sp. NPDC051541]|uniref:hypothetical protein n=1 Tax=Dactylosporangium sp. NPDC051541 TaxID=3363977 RepID=UPI00378D7036